MWTILNSLLNLLGLPWWFSGKPPTCHCWRLGFDLLSGISSGEGNGNLLHYSCLESPWTEKSGGLQSLGSQKSETLALDLETKQQH